MDQCSGCKREIVWVKTIAGKSMPADPGFLKVIPHKKGATTVITAEGRTVRGRLPFDDEPGGVSGQSVHWVTCKDRERFKV